MNSKKLLIAAIVTLPLFSCQDNTESMQGMIDDNIISSWKLVEIDGKTALTDKVDVITFKDYNRATRSSNWKTFTEKKTHIYTRKGNEILLMSTDNTGLVDMKLKVKSISDKELVADVEKIIISDDSTIIKRTAEQKYSIVTTDNSETIKGLWQGISSTNQTFGNENHRWEHFDDGTYTYFTKDSVTGYWIPSQNVLNLYYVDGDFLAYCWVDSINGTVYQESWNTSITGNRMYWNGEREDSIGQRFTSTFEMEKLAYPSESQLSQGLNRHSWKAVVQNGILTPTEYRSIREYKDGILIIKTPASTMSTGMGQASTLSMTYDTLDYTISDNVISETHAAASSMTLDYETTVSELSDTSFSARLKSIYNYSTPSVSSLGKIDFDKKKEEGIVTTTNNSLNPSDIKSLDILKDASATAIYGSRGANGTAATGTYADYSYTSFVVFDLVDKDYSTAIQGLWEGVELTGADNTVLNSTHRFEFLNNGKYRCYSKDGSEIWNFGDNYDFEMNYIVEGNMIGIEYTQSGRTVREWWDLDSIDGNDMSWSAYRLTSNFDLKTMTFEQVKSFPKFTLKKIVDK